MRQLSSEMFVPKVLFLLFNAYPEPLSVSNKLRRVDRAAGDHGEIAFYAATDCPALVPVFPKIKTKVRVYILQPVINSLRSEERRVGKGVDRGSERLQKEESWRS